MGLAVIAILLGICALFIRSFQTPGVGKWKVADSILSIAQNQSGRAEEITKQMVSKKLNAPSTTQYSEFRIIDSNGSFYQTIITVDSQNSLGTFVRGEFLCAFKFESGSLDQFSVLPGI